MGFFARLFGASGAAGRKAPARRSYSGAAATRLTAGWSAANQHPDIEIAGALATLRARARELERNDDYARRFFNLLKTNVIGPHGIKLQSKAKDRNGGLDTWANEQIEAAWKEWGKPKFCSVTGTLSRNELCKLVLGSVARDGEILVRKVAPWSGNPHRFALQLIEADQLDENFTGTLPNGNVATMGVEKDRWKRPVAYWLLSEHPGSAAGYARSERIRVPAEEIIHLFIAERVNQTRGVTWLASPAERIKMLNGYEEAELVAARVAASKMGFFTTPTGEEYLGDERDEDDTGAADRVPISEAEPGTFEQLPEGVDFKPWSPEHPVAAFADFEKAILRGIASGLNVSYVALANDLEGVSYSSIRSGELADRDHWRMLQGWFIDHFVEPVYEGWLTWWLTSGATRLPLSKFDKFHAPAWHPRGWAWVDPAKESAAAASDVKNGFKALAAVAGERGDDLEEIFADNAKALALAQKYGLNLELLTGETDHGN
jgi:lambda family phage portal protein